MDVHCTFEHVHCTQIHMYFSINSLYRATIRSISLKLFAFFAWIRKLRLLYALVWGATEQTNFFFSKWKHWSKIISCAFTYDMNKYFYVYYLCTYYFPIYFYIENQFWNRMKLSYKKNLRHENEDKDYLKHQNCVLIVNGLSHSFCGDKKGSLNQV